MTTENQTVETQKPAYRVSYHINHPSCVELRELLAQVNVDEAVIYRGTKNPKANPLITDKEKALLTAFQETDYNIKKTGEVLGVSHTNVWQRLYGDNKKVKPSIGILGKLRKYVAGEYVTELPQPAAEPVQEAEATTVA